VAGLSKFFEEDYQRISQALATLRARAQRDPSLLEVLHCFSWAVDARADDYDRGYRRGVSETQKKAEARIRAAIQGL
jgi:hypothetical protein